MVERAEDRLESVDLVLRVVELLAGSSRPRSLADISAALDISKPRAHRHLRALIINDYVRQEPDGDRYEIGPKLVGLGDQVRGRTSFAATVRPAMEGLLDATGQSVTASTLIAGEVTIVELLRGRTIVQFAIRPGTVMDLARSAHGRVALAFAKPGQLGGDANDGELIARVREQGWATAPNEIVRGVDALAAPVFGHDGGWAGTIAIVGSCDVVVPSPDLIGLVTGAARAASARLGWRG